MGQRRSFKSQMRLTHTGRVLEDITIAEGHLTIVVLIPKGFLFVP